MRKANLANFTVPLILMILFLVVLVVIILPIFTDSMPFLGDRVCTTSVQIRSMLSNIFGGFGRAVINDEVFNLFPLTGCNEHIIIETNAESAEQTIASEIIDCFMKYGADKLDGVFPSASIRCSTIIFDAPVDDEHEIDLMRVYSLLANNTVFQPYDYDADGFDDKNHFRFCIPQKYQYSLLLTMIKRTGMYSGETTDNGTLLGDATSNNYEEGDLFSDPLVAELMGEGFFCTSMMEGVLNSWQLNMYLPDLSNYPVEQYWSMCRDLCIRDCEMNNDVYEDYELCYGNCSNGCDTDCSKGDCSFTTPQRDYNFDEDLSGMFLPRDEDGITQPFTPIENFESSSVARRGTFYIRFFDYADWLQQIGDVGWHFFPECQNDIIFLQASGINQALSISSEGIEKKHDFVAICYTPYIPYSFLHDDVPTDTNNYITLPMDTPQYNTIFGGDD